MIALSVVVVQFSYFTKQCDFFVYAVFHVAVKHLELPQNLCTRIDLGILAKGGMKPLQFDKGIVIQLDLIVSLFGWVKHIVVDMIGHRSDTVHTTNALYQSGCVPRRVVIDNHVGAMQVDAFRQDIGSQDNIIR